MLILAPVRYSRYRPLTGTLGQGDDVSAQNIERIKEDTIALSYELKWQIVYIA